MKRLFSAAFAVLLLFAGGCGYALVGTGNFLSPDIKKVSFPIFKNSTSRIGLEQRLSAAVARELAARGRFQVSAREGDGDAELRGDITAFNLIPVAADSLGRATQYQISLVLKVALVKIPDGKPIWKNEHYEFLANYDMAAAGLTNEANYSDLVNQAIDAEADRFAQSLVTSILEGF